MQTKTFLSLDPVFSSFEEAIIVLDKERRINYLNTKAQQWLGIEPSGLNSHFISNWAHNGTKQVAFFNVKDYTIKPVNSKPIGEMLLALHDDHDRMLVEVKELPFDWQDDTYSIITMTEVKRKFLNEEVQRAIYEISDAAGSTADLDALFKKVHEIVSSLMPAKNLYIAIYDANSEFIFFPYYVDEKDYLQPEERKIKARDRKANRGLTEYLLHLGEPILLTEHSIRELSEQGEIRMIGSLPLEWLGIPLKTLQGNVIGALVIQTYTQGTQYTNNDRDLLGFVSTQVAMAIDRKLLEEKRKQELELFAAGPVVVFKLLVENHEKRVTEYVSPNIEQFGYSPEQFLKGELSYMDIVHPEDKALAFDLDSQQSNDSDNFLSEEYRIITAGGEIRWVYALTYIHKVRGDEIVEFIFYIYDITNHKETEKELQQINETLENRVLERTSQLKETQDFLQLVIDTIPAPVFILDRDLIYQGCNHAYEKLNGISQNEIVGKTIADIWPDAIAKQFEEESLEILNKGISKSYEAKIQAADGSYHDLVYFKAPYNRGSSSTPAGLVGVALDITDRKRSEKLQSVIYQISEAANATNDLDELFTFIHQVVNELIPARNLYIAIYDAETDTVSFPYFVDEYSEPPEPRVGGTGITEYVIKTGEPLLLTYENEEEVTTKNQIAPTGVDSSQWLGVPLQIESGKSIGVLVVQTYDEREISYTDADKELLNFVSNQIALAIERKQAQEALHKLNQELELKVAERTQQLNDQLEELRQRERELSSVVDMAQALRDTHQLEEIQKAVLESTRAAIDADGVSIAMLDKETNELVYVPGIGAFQTHKGLRLKIDIGAAGWVIKNKMVYLNNDLQNNPGPTLIEITGGVKSLLIAPMIVDGQVIGMLEAGSFQDWTNNDVRIMVALAEIAAYAIQRESLSEQKEHQLQRLHTLREIDRMIIGNFDLSSTLHFLVSQIAVQLQVEAVDILLVNENSSLITYEMGLGFVNQATRKSLVSMNHGPAEWVVENNQPMYIPEIQSSQWHEFFQNLPTEKFISYYAVPLNVKGRCTGVLEVFRRTNKKLDPEWEEFLYALGQQTAIAIENGQLVEKLTRANREMSFAYDRTIEGWARALDMRDYITGEHSKKVKEWTLILAQAMGIRDPETLTHIRRGATLHDIGKIGVPDQILNKPGPLNDEEWKIMRQHPIFARDILYPIEFLRPCIDIPYSHHERWDGTGYPQGLKGKEIPLVARIFAIIDVFNAITSERPYRKPWSKEKAIDYIHEQSGKHFDPEVVEVFLKNVDRLY